MEVQHTDNQSYFATRYIVTAALTLIASALITGIALLLISKIGTTYAALFGCGAGILVVSLSIVSCRIQNPKAGEPTSASQVANPPVPFDNTTQQNEINDLKKKLAAYQVSPSPDVTLLQNEIDDLKKQLAAYQASPSPDVTLLQKEIVELQIVNEKLKNQGYEDIEELNTQILTLRKALKDAHLQIVGFEQENTENQRNIKELGSTVTKLEEALSKQSIPNGLEEDAEDEHGNEVSTQRHTVPNLVTQNVEIERRLSLATVEIDFLQKANTQLQTELTEARHSIATYESMIKDLNQFIADSETTLKGLREEIDQLNRDNDKLRSQKSDIINI